LGGAFIKGYRTEGFLGEVGGGLEVYKRLTALIVYERFSCYRHNVLPAGGKIIV
jgi:hypothetical protein